MHFTPITVTIKENMSSRLHWLNHTDLIWYFDDIFWMKLTIHPSVFFSGLFFLMPCGVCPSIYWTKTGLALDWCLSYSYIVWQICHICSYIYIFLNTSIYIYITPPKFIKMTTTTLDQSVILFGHSSCVIAHLWLPANSPKRLTYARHCE